MSGICGWFNSPSSAQPESLAAMLSALGGYPADAQTNISHHAAGCAGETTPTGVYQDQDLLIAWQGWLANASDGKPNPGGNIASLYRQHGTEFLARLNGPCALALIDRRAERCVLVADRMAIHTIYYAENKGTLIFGSTANTVLAYPGVDGGLDMQSIFNYMYFHVVPAPRSIYRSVRRLLPGQCLIIDKGKSSRHYYWQVPYADDSAIPPAELAEELRTLLHKAVRTCAQDDSVGAFLSGGTDSSTVAGIFREIRGAPVDTYTIGFDAEGFDETTYAKIAARHFGTRYHEYYVSPDDVCSAIPLIAAAYDEPFGNASAVPTYYCARLAAADGIQTLLAGDGGDEIFAGNARYAKQKIFELYGAVPGIIKRALIEPLAFKLPGAASLPVTRKLRSYIEQARVPLPDRLESYNFLHQHDLRQIFTDDFLEQVDAEEPLLDLREIYARTASKDPVNRMMHVDMKITLSDNDLRKVGRMTALAGMRVRYPMLDEELVSFAGRVPSPLKLKGFRLRYFFKEALKDFLPPEILKKSKHGFGLPFGLWLGSHAPLRELAGDSLQSLRNRRYINPLYIDTLLNEHHREHASYYGVMVWILMMLEQWFQKNSDSSSV